MHSTFTPTCYSKSLPSSGGCSYLRRYSSNICIVGVYGLRSIQCGQLLTAPQLSTSQKALGTLPEDGNVMPKHVGATRTTHN
jgi:hypothetical protein